MKTIFDMPPEERKAHLEESKKTAKLIIISLVIGVPVFVLFLMWVNKPEHTAYELIKKNLKNPDGTYFKNDGIIDQRETKSGTIYFWAGEVYSKNSFGAVVRESYCLVFEKLDGNRESHYPDTYMKICSSPPTEDEVALMKSLNKWD